MGFDSFRGNDDSQLEKIELVPIPYPALMRPVLRGVLPYASLFDGSITLGQIVFLNDCLDRNDENERRIYKHHEKKWQNY